MNKAILEGFTGKDPEVKHLDSGKVVAKFSLATTSRRKDKDGKKISDWHNVVCWDKLAELVEKYVKKGSELIIEGEISYRDYTDKEGVKKYFTEIICNGLYFVGKKDSEPKADDKQGEWQGKKEVKEVITEPDELSDLPF